MPNHVHIWDVVIVEKKEAPTVLNAIEKRGWTIFAASAIPNWRRDVDIVMIVYMELNDANQTT